jgi:hypothetical protein
MKTLEERVDAMEERLARGDSRMSAIERDIRENTTSTNRVLEIVVMGEGFFRVMGHIGRILKWALAIGASIAAIIAAWKSGATP